MVSFKLSNLLREASTKIATTLEKELKSATTMFSTTNTVIAEELLCFNVIVSLAEAVL